MRGQCDAAFGDVVAHVVERDHVVEVRTVVIGEKDAIGVPTDVVTGDCRLRYDVEVDATAAVAAIHASRC